MERKVLEKTVEELYDEKLDRLVDTRSISYDEARRELGPPPYELVEPQATSRPMGRAALRQIV